MECCLVSVCEPPRIQFALWCSQCDLFEHGKYASKYALRLDQINLPMKPSFARVFIQSRAIEISKYTIDGVSDMVCP